MTLRFDGVSFSYGSGGLGRGPGTRVFEDFSWEVPAGRTVLLGPNGAGKTTLLGLGASALMPASGDVRLGTDSSTARRERAAFRRAVGWMPQQVRAIAGLTCREQVAYAGWLKGLDRRAAWEAAGEALERRGPRRRGRPPHVAALGRPAATRRPRPGARPQGGRAALDEPTAGLDPNQRARFRDILREVSRDVPVVVSTHQVDDLTDLFDTVVVMDHGRLPFSGTPAAFMALAPAGSAFPAEAAYGTLVAGD